MPDPLLVIKDNNTPQQELEPAQQTYQKPKRSIIIEDTTVQVKGKDHIIWGVPETHVLVHRSYLEKLQNKASQIDELNQSVRKKYTRTPLAKRLLASALASVPGLSLLGAELVIPLIVAAFLADSHLIDDNLDFNLFSKSFASAHNLRDILISFTVYSLIEVGNQICGAENVFVLCDKGNKKGLSHFVKILSWWDRIEKKVQTFVLDIDASEGTSEGCAEAIQHSMKKVHNTIALVLKGQTTDSGGGCVRVARKAIAKEGPLQCDLPSSIMYAACYLNSFSQSSQESHGRRLTGSMHKDADATLCLPPARINGIW
jgi:hypothetical protein